MPKFTGLPRVPYVKGRMGRLVLGRRKAVGVANPPSGLDACAHICGQLQSP
jgi:hypothetical protein